VHLAGLRWSLVFSTTTSLKKEFNAMIIESPMVIFQKWQNSFKQKSGDNAPGNFNWSSNPLKKIASKSSQLNNMSEN